MLCVLAGLDVLVRDQIMAMKTAAGHCRRVAGVLARCLCSGFLFSDLITNWSRRWQGRCGNFYNANV